jgi:dipeptidase E
MKLLLTCSGIEGTTIINQFKKMLNTKIENTKVLWIPTAAIDDEAIAYTEKCKNDLLSIGIQNHNIFTYNLDYEFNLNNINNFDVIFVCGGDCRYLLDKIHSINFDKALYAFIGIYFGVSAGSCIVSYDFEDGLNYLKCRLDVHCNTGTACGIIDIDNTNLISLTDNQAVLIENKTIKVIE